MGRVTWSVRVLAAVLILAGIAGCSSEGTTGHTDRSAVDADCAAAIRFHGHLYWGRSVTEHIAYGRTLGHGVIPSCQDGGGPGEPATVRAIRGQDSRIVIANDGQPLVVYLHDRRAPMPAGLYKAQ